MPNLYYLSLLLLIIYWKQTLVSCSWLLPKKGMQLQHTVTRWGKGALHIRHVQKNHIWRRNGRETLMLQSDNYDGRVGGQYKLTTRGKEWVLEPPISKVSGCPRMSGDAQRAPSSVTTMNRSCLGLKERYFLEKSKRKMSGLGKVDDMNCCKNREKPRAAQCPADHQTFPANTYYS